MPIYFQKISDANFNADGDFYVKDSRGCNMNLGILFLAVFVLTMSKDGFNTKALSIYQLLYLSVLPGLYLIKRGIINKTIITINKSGFYYFDELVTNWHNFIDALVTQDEENRNIPYDVTDRFMLVIRYGKIGHTGFFARKILMTAAMDKSEEEIMAAIKFYYERREAEMTLPYLPEEHGQPPNPRLLKPPDIK